MVISNEKEILNLIKNQSIKSPVLVYGAEEYLKQSFIKLLIPKESGFSSFNHIKIDFTGFDLQQFSNAVITPPMMEPLKTVFVYNVAPKEMNTDLFKQLEKIFSDLFEDCRVVFLEKSGSFDDKKCDKSKKAIKLFDKYGTVLNIKERSPAELAKFIKSEAQRMGITIDPETAKYLIARCGKEIAQLKNELIKLCAFADGKSITKAMIDNLTVQQVEDNIYGLSKNIISGNYDAGMHILSDLLYLKYPPEFILGTMSAFFIDLYRAKVGSGKRPADIAQDFGYGKRTFVIDNAMREQKKLSQHYLCEALECLAKADVRLKSTQLNSRLILEETLNTLFILRR